MDSLNQEYTNLLFLSNQSTISFIVNSSFVNQHFALDHLTKLSYLDTILMNSSTKYSNTVQALYTAFTEDLILQTNTFFLPFSSLLQSEYQETFSTTLIIAPELSSMFNDYIYSYITPSAFMHTPAAVFDSYLSN